MSTTENTELVLSFWRQALHVDVKRAVAEGDLVVTHSHFHLVPGDRGLAAADFWRVVDGKIIEHWDVIQEVPEQAQNANTMF